MKLFVPEADTDEQAFRILESIKRHLSLPSIDNLYHQIVWVHDGKSYNAIVGNTTNFNGELVIAIVYDQSSDLYHVCTPTRGVVRGCSILVGGSTVSASSKFSAQ
jgi:hypothetical protein